MRDYGICLWSFGDIPVEKKCQLAKEIGVTGVEVEGNLAQNPAELASLLKQYQLKVLSVTPNNVDISSADEEVRKQAVAYFLDLLDWASELGAFRICLHGEVGKIEGSDDATCDWERLVKSTKAVMEKAEKLGIAVVFEVLNRYENHQVVTGAEALQLIQDVASPSLSVLLDAYHMNIEEPNPVATLEKVNTQLGMYHVADSNRQAIGNGHADIKGQIEALHKVNYKGPIIMEMVAEGPNPFKAEKEENYLDVLSKYYRDSLEQIKSWDGI
ncbi:sugar phosphate isomerase/epimerase family protein [Listeria kieliensis]|uniref:Xylose isomerase n=1 Tax=Listeria kieliensis TaxID=1621700 RepID=A0A3D8TP58_9LIST|nr:sugar phosphate isomerase/epimerase family protein [Listeria kieliensis]RDX00668.1 xylose isomerase [Listeria kieliensis]